jgi:two-component system, OmpR family, response regulator RegX3
MTPSQPDDESRGEPRGRLGRGGAARLLLVSDQPVLADLIALTLNHGRFAIRRADTAAAAATCITRQLPHLAILDLDLEGLSGERVLERIGFHTLRTARVPVIALTRRGDLKTKLAAFARGVDDILTVPFSPEELVARSLALMRRTYGEAVAFAPTVRVGELEIDIFNRRVRAGTSELHLTPLEQSLLYLLAANAGRLLTRDEIMDHLWGSDYIADSNVVDRHIRNLRAKLQNDWRHPRFVATIPGRGYRFLPTVSGDDAPAEQPDG